MTPLEKMKETVKKHYNVLLSDFFKAIDGIDIKDLPAIHIPVIGSNYGSYKYRDIAIYGMEGKAWKNMLELKSALNIGEAYKYLTEDFISMKIFNKIKKRSFFGFVFKFLGRLYNINLSEKGDTIAFKNEEEGRKILQSIIWGNIHALEKRNLKLSKKEGNEEEPDNWQKVRKESEKIFDAHLFAPKEEYDPRKDQLRYMLETCQPKALLILHWDFNFGYWLEKNYNTFWIIEDKADYFCYAHIKTDKIDTHVYKCDHPRHIKSRGENFFDIIDRIKNDFKERSTRSSYE
jgi:hypothetical protein